MFSSVPKIVETPSVRRMLLVAFNNDVPAHRQVGQQQLADLEVALAVDGSVRAAARGPGPCHDICLSVPRAMAGAVPTTIFSQESTVVGGGEGRAKGAPVFVTLRFLALWPRCLPMALERVKGESLALHISELACPVGWLGRVS